MKKKFLFAITILALFGTVGFAQRSGTLGDVKIPELTLTLTIRSSNAPLGQLLVDNQQIRFGKLPLDLHLPVGQHVILARSPGFQDLQLPIALNRNESIDLIFQTTNFSLSISSNIRNAQVYINNQPSGQVGRPLLLPAGTYQVRVSAPGFQDFSTTVTLNQNQVVNANLSASNFLLTVVANIKGAQVFVNGNLVGLAGGSFPLPAGVYQVRVSAPGFQDFTGNVQLNGNQTLNATLMSRNYNLSINNQNKGVTVFINGRQVGFAGSAFQLPPGDYDIRIVLPGFQDYQQRLTLNSDQVITPVFMPLNGTLVVDVQKGTAVQVYIDGQLQAGSGPISLPLGQHNVRFEVGFLSAETTVNITQGQTLTVSPFLSVMVR